MAGEHPRAGIEYPRNWHELLARCPDDAACLRYLEQRRWVRQPALLFVPLRPPDRGASWNTESSIPAWRSRQRAGDPRFWIASADGSHIVDRIPAIDAGGN